MSRLLPPVHNGNNAETLHDLPVLLSQGSLPACTFDRYGVEMPKNSRGGKHLIASPSAVQDPAGSLSAHYH